MRHARLSAHMHCTDTRHTHIGNDPKHTHIHTEPKTHPHACPLRYWVESHFDDFEEELVRKLFDFCDNTLLPDKQTALAKQLKDFLTNKVRTHTHTHSRIHSCTHITSQNTTTTHKC